MKTLQLFIFLLIISIIFSCGEEKTETAKKVEKVNIDSREIDACSMIEKDEVEKIFNVKMKEPNKGRSQKGGPNQVSFSECSFESDIDESRIFLSIYIRFTSFGGDNRETIQTVRSSFKNSGIEIKDIDGIGDVAFWGGNQLHVFQGDNYYIIITLIGINEADEAIEKAKSVTSYVIGNLNSV